MLSLNHNGTTLEDPKASKMIFFFHMKELLGIEAPVHNFDPARLYPTENFAGIQSDFTVQEIEGAISKLAKNKASGPDVLPNEFAQLYWPEIKDTVVHII